MEVNLEFDTLGVVWMPIDKEDPYKVMPNTRVKEHVIYVKHFMKPVEVRISYIEGAPSPYTIKFMRCKWTGYDLNKLMRDAEENIKHVK